jgi:DNA-binding winged helix-turn-helix (wHTH) protein
MPVAWNSLFSRNVHLDVSNIRFAGGLEFDTASGELRRGTSSQRLEPQPAAVLRELAARPGELVKQEELARAVWGASTHVKLPDSLHYCVRQVRTALGDNPREPLFIETVPRRGYRLRPECLAGPERRLPLQRWALRLTLAGVLLVAAAAIEQRPNNHHQIAVSALTALHDLLF